MDSAPRTDVAWDGSEIEVVEPIARRLAATEVDHNLSIGHVNRYQACYIGKERANDGQLPATWHAKARNLTSGTQSTWLCLLLPQEDSFRRHR